jgi:hypothetical protein
VYHFRECSIGNSLSETREGRAVCSILRRCGLGVCCGRVRVLKMEGWCRWTKWNLRHCKDVSYDSGYEGGYKELGEVQVDSCETVNPIRQLYHSNSYGRNIEHLEVRGGPHVTSRGLESTLVRQHFKQLFPGCPHLNHQRTSTLHYCGIHCAHPQGLITSGLDSNSIVFAQIRRPRHCISTCGSSLLIVACAFCLSPFPSATHIFSFPPPDVQSLAMRL